MKTIYSDELVEQYESVCKKLGYHLPGLIKGYTAKTGVSPEDLIRSMKKAEIPVRIWWRFLESAVLPACIIGLIVCILVLVFGTLSVAGRSTVLAAVQFFLIVFECGAILALVAVLSENQKNKLMRRFKQSQTALAHLTESLRDLADVLKDGTGFARDIVLRRLHEMAVEKIALERLDRDGYHTGLEIRRLAKIGEEFDLFSGKLDSIFDEAEKDWARRTLAGEFTTDFVI